MRQIRGFKIGRRLIRISRWIIRPKRSPTGYNRLIKSEPACRPKTITRLVDWSRRLTTGAKTLCFAKSGSGYVPLGKDPLREKPVTVPKGHLAVYVGQKDDDFRRVLVPVIYFNHPLFGELLREAEEEYGYNQQGGITIPCRFSEFEKVRTRIAAWTGGRGRWRGDATSIEVVVYCSDDDDDDNLFSMLLSLKGIFFQLVLFSFAFYCYHFVTF